MLDYRRATNGLLDSFCGYGTMLCVAEELGMDSVGVDIDPASCEAARNFILRSAGPAGVTSSSS